MFSRFSFGLPLLDEVPGDAIEYSFAQELDLIREARWPLSDILLRIDMIAEIVSELARLDVSAARSRRPESTNDCARVRLCDSELISPRSASADRGFTGGREPVFIPTPPPLQ